MPWYRRDGDKSFACLVQPMQIIEKMRRGLDEVALRREVENIGAGRERAAEIEPAFSCFPRSGVQPELRARRIMRRHHAGGRGCR